VQSRKIIKRGRSAKYQKTSAFIANLEDAAISREAGYMCSKLMFNPFGVVVDCLLRPANFAGLFMFKPFRLSG
jgi:hypothetical protein